MGLIDLSGFTFTIHAEGSDGTLKFTGVSPDNHTLNGGSVFGDPITSVEYAGNTPQIRFRRSNSQFTEIYSGAVVTAAPIDDTVSYMLVGTFTHTGYAPGTCWFWCTDPTYSDALSVSSAPRQC